jgi:hypothetical protein
MCDHVHVYMCVPTTIISPASPSYGGMPPSCSCTPREEVGERVGEGEGPSTASYEPASWSWRVTVIVLTSDGHGVR